MRWPGKVPAGAKCDEVVAGFDLFTTFAKVAGAAVPKDRIIDGKDVTPLMFGTKGAKSPHEAIYFYQGYNLVAVRAGKWKLVLGAPKAPKKGVQLFDLDADVGETKDLADKHPDVVKKLQALLEKAREDLGDALSKRAGKNRRKPGEAG
jgi:arylsulfatase A